VTSARAQTTIAPSRGWGGVRLRELWEYRELFWFLTWRDVKVRYKQTALGAAWAILQPVLAMVVFSLFFGRLAGIPSDGVAYPLFAFAALVPWTFFSTALSLGSNSLVEHEQLVSKVYFPRLIVPVAAVLACLVDFAIAFVVLLGLMTAYGHPPALEIVAVPLFVALAVATAIAVCVWLSALNVLYRDVRYTLPFLVQLWLFASPVVYPSSLVPDAWRWVYGLNPMAGVIDGFRWALLGQGDAPGATFAVSVGVVVLLLAGGLLYFRRMERSFADVV
jgi:lipopolysaccharide transport system permease protein